MNRRSVSPESSRRVNIVYSLHVDALFRRGVITNGGQIRLHGFFHREWKIRNLNIWGSFPGSVIIYVFGTERPFLLGRRSFGCKKFPRDRSDKESKFRVLIWKILPFFTRSLSAHFPRGSAFLMYRSSSAVISSSPPLPEGKLGEKERLNRLDAAEKKWPC